MPKENTDTYAKAPPENKFSRAIAPEATEVPVFEKARYPLEGDTGHGNVRTETVQHKHGDGENDLAAQLFDRECVFKTS